MFQKKGLPRFRSYKRQVSHCQIFKSFNIPLQLCNLRLPEYSINPIQDRWEGNVGITRTLTLEGKVLIFKTLGISKIFYLSLIITVSNSILEEIQKIQKTV